MEESRRQVQVLKACFGNRLRGLGDHGHTSRNFALKRGPMSVERRETITAVRFLRKMLGGSKGVLVEAGDRFRYVVNGAGTRRAIKQQPMRLSKIRFSNLLAYLFPPGQRFKFPMSFSLPIRRCALIPSLQSKNHQLASTLPCAGS